MYLAVSIDAHRGVLSEKIGKLAIDHSQMDSSKQIVYEVITGYTGKALNGYSYLTQDEEHTLLTVVDVAQSKEKSEPHYVGVSVIVRIMGDMVIIDRDQNDKLVIDALVQAGIPREQIILAYAGESVPEVTV